MRYRMRINIIQFICGAILPFLLCSFQLPSKEKEISVSGKINLNADYMVYYSGKSSAGSQLEEMQLTDDGRFSWKGKARAPFFLTIGFYPASKSYQMPAQFTLLVEPGKQINLELNYSKETYLTLVKNNFNGGNAALFNYGAYFLKKAFELWNNPVPFDKRKDIFGEYINQANILIKQYKVKNNLVKQYLKIWSYNNYIDAMSSSGGAARRGSTSASTTDWYPSAAEMKDVYDHSLAVQIPSSLSNMAAYVNALHGDAAKSQRGIVQLETNILAVKKVFHHNQVRDELITMIIEKFVRGYKIENNVDFGADVKMFDQLAAHVSDESIRKKLIEGFSSLRYTIVGAEMPDVMLKDINDNNVSLHRFKGKHLYIDLWASWCVPCIQEVPALQQLEHDYADANITFLSLTLDADKVAWKKKLKELNMHGNQLDASDSGLDKVMNVTGIPRFLLYDADGKLLLLHAPRPSSKEIREVFDKIK